MSTRAARIEAALTQHFTPAALLVVDDSAKHAGHAGAQPGGETHYSVLVVSTRFTGLGRVGRHRLVNQVLAEEFATGLHALALRALAPDEAVQPPSG